MTPTRLRRALGRRLDTAQLDQLDPPELAMALEGMAESAPADRALAELTAQAQTWADPGDLKATGLRLERLVRWDGWTATYEANETVTGRTVIARVLRAHARTPVHRRRLLREGRALRERLDMPVRHIEGVHPSLVIDVAGGPALSGARPGEARQLRFVLGVLSHLEDREASGLGPVDPDDLEIRMTEHGASVVCLQADPDPLDLGDLAARLEAWVPEGALSPVFQGATILPPGSVAELADRIVQALATELAHRRHEAVHRWKARRHAHERARLRALVSRLSSFGPPRGRGVVGVDLEGRPTLLIGTEGRLSWGPTDGPTLAIVSDNGLHPRTARRLLRARAEAPPSARLNEASGADPAFTEHACRWVAASLSLRTLRLLLEVPA